MTNYSVYVAPALKVKVETTMNPTGIGRKIVNKILPNSSRHWERIGTIQSKNKKLALEWLKKNQTIESGFVFVVIKPKLEA